jgi:hypothetical protein
MFCTETSLLTECFVLEYSYRLNVLYWKIPTDWMACTGISLLTECFVLECPYRLNGLYWNVLTDGLFGTSEWMFCTGTISTDWILCPPPPPMAVEHGCTSTPTTLRGYRCRLPFEVRPTGAHALLPLLPRRVEVREEARSVAAAPGMPGRGRTKAPRWTWQSELCSMPKRPSWRRRKSSCSSPTVSSGPHCFWSFTLWHRSSCFYYFMLKLFLLFSYFELKSFLCFWYFLLNFFSVAQRASAGGLSAETRPLSGVDVTSDR